MDGKMPPTHGNLIDVAIPIDGTPKPEEEQKESQQKEEKKNVNKRFRGNLASQDFEK